MELEPITRQEQIIAGKDVKPITRMEMFLKNYGGGASSWNDLTDKPFGEETEAQILIDSATLSITGDDFSADITTETYHPYNILTYELLKDLAPSGSPIRVVWDGVNYEFPTGFEVTDEVIEGVVTCYIGNKGLVIDANGENIFSEEDNGLPFCLRVTYFQVMVWGKDIRSHEMSIYEYVTTVKPSTPSTSPKPQQFQT